MLLDLKHRPLFLGLTLLLVPTLGAVTSFADIEDPPDAVCIDFLESAPEAMTEWDEGRRISALEDRLRRPLTGLEAQAVVDALHVTLWSVGSDGYHTASVRNRTSAQTQQKLDVLTGAGLSLAAAQKILQKGLVDYPYRLFDFGGLERRGEVLRISGLGDEAATLIESRLNFGFYRAKDGTRAHRPRQPEENDAFKQAVSKLPKFAGSCYAVAPSALVAASVRVGPGAILALPEDLVCAGREDRFEEGQPTNSVIVEIFSLGQQGRRVEEFSFRRTDRPALFPGGSRLELQSRRTDARGNQRIRLVDMGLHSLD